MKRFNGCGRGATIIVDEAALEAVLSELRSR